MKNITETKDPEGERKNRTLRFGNAPKLQIVSVSRSWNRNLTIIVISIEAARKKKTVDKLRWGEKYKHQNAQTPIYGKLQKYAVCS